MSLPTKTFDLLIIGGGIAGTSTARAVGKKFPSLKIGLIEKEAEFARHQSNRNSHVIHAGIYYRPGTYRGRLCRRGMDLWYDYCAERNIEVEETGKLILGDGSWDNDRVKELVRRSHGNGAAEVEIVDNNEANKIANERQCIEDDGAVHLWSPRTATMDIEKANKEIEKDIRDLDNVEIMMNTMVKSTIRHNDQGVDLHVVDNPYGGIMGSNFYMKKGFQVSAKGVVNCAGNYSDKVAQLLGVPQPYKGVLLKGYYTRDALDHMNNDFPRPLLYPIPPENTANVVLGSHTTLGSDYIKIGPSGFPGFWRENYEGFERLAPSEVIQTVYNGATMMMTKNRKTFIDMTFKQQKIQNIPALLESMNYFKLRPEEKGDFYWYKPCLSNFLFHENGDFVHDFKFLNYKRSISVQNYNSPGWTSGPATGEMMANEKIPELLNQKV